MPHGSAANRSRGNPRPFRITSYNVCYTKLLRGYAKENAAGIPLDAPNRNYKDQNHKPEILAALTPFTALCGFRTVPETVDNFRRLGIDGLSAIVGKLEETGDYRAFIKELLCMGDFDSRNICRALGKTLSEDNGPIDAANCSYRRAKDTAKGIFGKYPDDLGSLAPFYLNVVILSPGEAIFLSPGIMHAYLAGTGFVLMSYNFVECMLYEVITLIICRILVIRLFG